MNSIKNITDIVQFNHIDPSRLVPNAEYDRREAEERAKAQRTRAKNFMDASGAPLRHLKSQLNTAGTWGANLNSLKKRVGKGMLTLIIGPRGTGKTQLAVELMRHAASLNRQPLYTDGTSISFALRASIRNDSKVSEQDVVKRYMSPRLLVVDEWGKAKESEYMTEIMFHILNGRYASMLDTILLSNHDKEGAIAELGPSLLSRVQECGDLLELGNKPFREGDDN